MSIIYAKPGDSYQQFGGNCPEGWVTMQRERPQGDHVAGDNGEWVVKTVTYADELGKLNSAYTTARLELCHSWLVAAVADGVSESKRKVDVEVELAELDSQHGVSVVDLKTKYGISK